MINNYIFESTNKLIVTKSRIGNLSDLLSNQLEIISLRQD